MRIKDFFLFYRGNIDGASITPKLHIIEDHMVDFLRQWRLGRGFLGDQGAELIHKTFNEQHHNYSKQHGLAPHGEDGAPPQDHSTAEPPHSTHIV